MISPPADEYTAETIWTMALVPFLIVVCVVIATITFLMWRHLRRVEDPDDTGFALGAWLVSTLVALLIGLSLWWGMYPWKADYHEWRAVSGTVEQINHRLTSTGEKSMEDKYVVKFWGNTQQYGVLDTRMATVEEGDDLVITCVRRYQWSGTHGYDCNFVDTQRGSVT